MAIFCSHFYRPALNSAYSVVSFVRACVVRGGVGVGWCSITRPWLGNMEKDTFASDIQQMVCDFFVSTDFDPLEIVMLFCI